MVKNPPANAGDQRDVDLIPGLERSPGEGRTWQPTLVFLPGESPWTSWRTIVHAVTQSRT